MFSSEEKIVNTFYENKNILRNLCRHNRKSREPRVELNEFLNIIKYLDHIKLICYYRKKRDIA